MYQILYSIFFSLIIISSFAEQVTEENLVTEPQKSFSVDLPLNKGKITTATNMQYPYLSNLYIPILFYGENLSSQQSEIHLSISSANVDSNELPVINPTYCNLQFNKSCMNQIHLENALPGKYYISFTVDGQTLERKITFYVIKEDNFTLHEGIYNLTGSMINGNTCTLMPYPYGSKMIVSDTEECLYARLS